LRRINAQSLEQHLIGLIGVKMREKQNQILHQLIELILLKDI